MDEIQQTTASVAVDSRSFVERKGTRGAKIAQFEQKKHVIQNGIILLFCLILFIGSFFIGVNFKYEHYIFTYSNNDKYKQTPLFTVQLNTIQFIEGTLAVLDNGEKVSSYVRENDDDFYLILADCLLTDEEKANLDQSQMILLAQLKIAGLPSDDELCTVIGNKLSQSDVNYLKFYVYTALLGDYYHGSSDMAVGYSLGYLVLALELCVMITSLVFSIMALVALISGNKLKKPLLSLLLPLIFILILVVLISINYTYIMTDVLVAMVVLSVLSVILLAVHKMLFGQKSETHTVQNIAKKFTLTAIGLVACFVALAPLFTYTLTIAQSYISPSGDNYTWTISGHDLLRFLSAYEGRETIYYADTMVFVLLVNLLYIGALISLITVVLSVCIRLYNDKPNALLVRTIMSMIMSVLTILFIFVIKSRYNDPLYHNEYFNADIRIGIGLFISVAMCIALIAVDNAWKTAPKLVAEEPTQVQ